MCCPEDLEVNRDAIEFDPEYLDFMAPWDGQEEPNTRRDRYHYWPNTDYFAELVSVLQAHIRRLQAERTDIVVIETGVGQGYVTRRLAPLMRPENDLYWAYEPHAVIRQEISLRDFWLKNLSACIKEHPTPEHHEMAIADLVIVNSPVPWSMAEFYLWKAVTNVHSMMITTAPVFPDIEVEGSIVAQGDVDEFKAMWTAMVEHPVTQE